MFNWLWFLCFFFFFSSRRRHTRSKRDWSSDVCSSDLLSAQVGGGCGSAAPWQTRCRARRRQLRRSRRPASSRSPGRRRRRGVRGGSGDRKSTRLNSSHVSISYAVFCLKKKKK